MMTTHYKNEALKLALELLGEADIHSVEEIQPIRDALGMDDENAALREKVVQLASQLRVTEDGVVILQNQLAAVLAEQKAEPVGDPAGYFRFCVERQCFVECEPDDKGAKPLYYAAPVVPAYMVMVPRAAIERIEQWSKAYPTDIFPEPDFDKVREALEGSGISLDAVSASNMRHVITKVWKLIAAAQEVNG